MRKINIELYTFNELSEEIREKMVHEYLETSYFIGDNHRLAEEDMDKVFRRMLESRGYVSSTKDYNDSMIYGPISPCELKGVIRKLHLNGGTKLSFIDYIDTLLDNDLIEWVIKDNKLDAKIKGKPAETLKHSKDELFNSDIEKFQRNIAKLKNIISDDLDVISKEIEGIYNHSFNLYSSKEHAVNELSKSVDGRDVEYLKDGEFFLHFDLK